MNHAMDKSGSIQSQGCYDEELNIIEMVSTCIEESTIVHLVDGFPIIHMPLQIQCCRLIILCPCKRVVRLKVIAPQRNVHLHCYQ